ncbi:MAG: hypothetical protein H0W89_07565 [Candidatus Levybacteria bacterium]|nr:hypothetical protein [Candidatus Levybacteria bacterium]
MAKKQNTVHYFKLLTQYGVHIWAILIIANATLAYAFHFSTNAAYDTITLQENVGPDEITETPEASPTVTNKKSKDGGPTLDLTFTIPGVGSGGGVMTPARLKRNVTIFLYGPDDNSLNKTVKPLYVIQDTVDYDTNTVSPTYTTYGNQTLALGKEIKPGRYQITFRTDESLRTIIKEDPNSIGGKIFEIDSKTKLKRTPIQTVLMGDTLPKEGDNIVDISDYNAFVNCFGERSTTSFCTGNNYGDFDDNGVIDGVDYNLLLRSFSALLKQGQSIPQITTAPTGPQRVSRLSNQNTPAPTQGESEAKPSPSAAPKANSGSAGNVIGGILFFIFLLIAGATGFVLFKKNEKFRNLVKAIIHRSPTGTPSATAADHNAPPALDSTTATPPADPAAIAASTEMPIAPSDTLVQPTIETPPLEPAPVDPVTPTETQTPPADGTIEKDCYIKKRLPDEAGTGFWVTLTDNNGALEGHFTGADVIDGFAKVKGIMKTENDKTFLEISEIKAEE